MNIGRWIAASFLALLLTLVAVGTALGQDPPTVVTNAATDVTTDSATLNGNLVSLGNASSVDVSFEWGLTISYGNETIPQTLTGTGAFSDGIGGLLPGTTYHFRAKAVGNDTAYGDDMILLTSTDPPVVTTEAASDVAGDSATLNGLLMSLGSAGSVEVSFEWGLTTSYGDETTPETVTATGPFSDGISGLDPGQTYHFRAKAVGNGTAYGDDRMFNTSSNPPTVTTLAVADIATHSATLHGNLTGLGTAGSVDVSFEWGLTTSYGNETSAQTLTNAAEFSSYVADLAPNTTYHVRAKAVGNGTSYGEDVTFTTLRSISLEGSGWCSSTNRLVTVMLEGSLTMGNRTHTEQGFSLHVMGNVTLSPGEPDEMTIDVDLYGSRVRSLFYLRQESTGRSVSLQGSWIDAEDGRYYIMASGAIALPNPEGEVFKTAKVCFVILRTPEIDVPLPESGNFVQDVESIVTRITNIVDKIWDNLMGSGFSELLSDILSKLAVLVVALRDALGGSYVS